MRSPALLSSVATLPAVVAMPHRPLPVEGGGAGAVGGGGTLQPIDGTGFVPVGQGVPGVGGSPQGHGPGGAAQQAPDGAPQAPGGQPAAEGIDAKQGIAALAQQFGEEYADPIVTSDGRVLMRKRQPEIVQGRIAVTYELAGKIQGDKLLLNEAFLKKAAPAAQKAQAAAPASQKVVKEGDRYYLQSTSKGPDGKLVATLDPMSDEQVQAYAQQVQQQEAQQASEAWNADKGQWVQKTYDISGKMRVVSTAGTLVEGLMNGPYQTTGRPSANWMTGYFLLQMLDGQAEGKLLPQWMKTGPVGTALEWGIQLPFLLDMGQDLRVLGAAFPRTAAVLNAFNAPTRAVLKGVTNISKAGWAATAPANAGGIAGAAALAAQGGQRVGLAGEALQAAASGAQTATAASSATDGALKALGQGLRTRSIHMVGAPDSVLAAQSAVLTSEGVQLVGKDAVQQAMKLSQPAVTGGAKVQQAMNNGVHGALGALRPYLRPLQLGASLFGAIGGALNLQMMVKNNGWQSLGTTKQGRSVLFGFLGSAAFLGMLTLPGMAGLGAAAPVIASGLNVASNVFQAVSLLSYGGLFGEGGYLDHDGVRAAFLIPPLTPIGLYAMWMKRRQKAAAEKQAAEQAKQQHFSESLTGYMQQTMQSIQAGQKPQESVQREDGSITVVTPFTQDGQILQQPGAAGAPGAPAGAPAPAQGQAPPQAAAQQQQQGGPDARTLRMMSSRI